MVNKNLFQDNYFSELEILLKSLHRQNSGTVNINLREFFVSTKLLYLVFIERKMLSANFLF